MTVDLRDRIGDIAQRLLGIPNAKLSSRAQLRFGANGSVAVEIDGTKGGSWFDHETGIGGGPWDLLRVKGGLSDADIPDWLHRELDIGIRHANGHDGSTSFKITAIYEYVDESGSLLFQVCRLFPKTFRQRRPNGTGEWQWSTKGVRNVPYRLPELIAAAGNANGTPWRIHILEGEKDVDRLRQWGLVATTNAGGAGKWSPDFGRYFASADVVIIADNDDAGRSHANAIAANLHPVAASIRILELGGVPDKGDVSDWIEAGGTKADLETLVDLSPRFRPTKEAWPDASENHECGVSLDDFYAYMPMHSYIFAPAREMWPAASVNARIPPTALVDDAGRPLLDDAGKPQKSASAWLDRKKPVEQMTWAPGFPMLIRDRLTSQAGWIERKAVSCFNLYRPPLIELGDPIKATPWLEHVHKVYPDDAKHIITWLAHRVQRPEEKVNHALVLGGQQGIGKDTLLEPVKRAIGAWNWQEISPRDVLGRFNGFAKSVILRINEGRDLGDVNRFSFYDHMKSYTAAPPDVLRVDEKNLREYYVHNCCGVIITTNHKTDGIYLPADDRRHFVAWSSLARTDFAEEYWIELWAWYQNGGDRDVAAYLMHLDIGGLDAKAPPPKTAAFWAIVDAGRAPEDAELADAIECLGSPPAFVLADLLGKVSSEFADWLQDRKNRRIIPHRLEACGYLPVRNPDATDGLWRIRQRRQVIYVKDSLAVREQLTAARGICDNR